MWSPAAAGGVARNPPDLRRSPSSLYDHSLLPDFLSTATTSSPIADTFASLYDSTRDPWNPCRVDTLPWPMFAAASVALAVAGAPAEKPFDASSFSPSA